MQVLIIGQGLAGSTLAWQLHWRGHRIHICDPGLPHTASRVAAGLITPITGQRLVPYPNFLSLWKVARQFYRSIEELVGHSLLTEQSAVRVFQSPAETEIYEQRLLRGEFDGLTNLPLRELSEEFLAPWGTFEMSLGGKLDVPLYLDRTHDYFNRLDSCTTGTIDPELLQLHQQTVYVPELGREFDRVVFCQGYAAPNRWFPEIRFNPAQGEILTLRIPDLAESRTVHGSVWLTSSGENFQCGSTYSQSPLDCIPTAAGRDEILQRLQRMLSPRRSAIEVLEHRAAVRPTTLDSQPVFRTHLQHPQLACLNGLGSKGVLLAPCLAARLADQFESI